MAPQGAHGEGALVAADAILDLVRIVPEDEVVGGETSLLRRLEDPVERAPEARVWVGGSAY